MDSEKVVIVLLNYNGWRDTLECLESVLKLDYPHFQVVVVDNDSSDGSVEKIQAWAAGTLMADVQNEALATLSMPAQRKPVALEVLREGQASAGGDARRVVLIQSTRNGGYAAGNNHGIRFAIADPDCRYLWLLNNDTVVRPNALAELVARFQAKPEVGICGSALVHYHNPATLQARGGARFNRWTATSHHVGEGAPFPASVDAPPGEALDYVVGASMFVSRRFVDQVGLMYEDYFLYFEEIDWAWRRGSFAVAYAPGSVVYHKEGATTGMNKKAVQYGKGGDFYLHRNRLVFARRNFLIGLPVVVLRLLVVAAKSVQARRWGRARMFLAPRFWFGSGKV